MAEEKWIRYGDKIEYGEIAGEHNIASVVAKIIRNRGVDRENIGKYLAADLKDLYSPFLMKDMDKAVNIILEKIAQKRSIRVVGDYDIDGICSTYILVNALKDAGGVVSYDIPDRVKDGYGINEAIIEKAYEDKVDTIITCDNGIAAVSAIKLAKTCGMTVIVTDHHEVPFEEMDGKLSYIRVAADATLNPHQPDCSYPFKLLCGGGVALKLIMALYEKMGKEHTAAMKYIEYAAIATIGDIVDLQGENRVIAKRGLEAIRATKNKGLNALINECELVKANISAYHIGFVIGPCLNASGRLETAKLGYELLCCEDDNEAVDRARNIRELNERRKDITEQGTKKAMELAEEYDKDRVLIIYLQEIHESVAGIIAGRVKEKFNKPTVVLTDSDEEGVIKGSGRSIEAYDMYSNLSKVKNLFKKFGGHKMAAGLSLDKALLNEFRQQINESCELTKEDLAKKIYIDSVLKIENLTLSMPEELRVLEPFGKGNEKPVFALSKAEITKLNIVGKNRNVVKLRLRDSSGKNTEGVIFNRTEEFLEFVANKFGAEELDKLLKGRTTKVNISCIFYPDINEYNGMKNLQIIINSYC